MGLNPGRVAAATALLAVERGAHLEDQLAHLAPAGPDRGLAWHVAYGVLRRRGEIDAALRVHLSRPLPSLDREVRVALRVGTFEKLFSRTKAHAAVHQGVELVAAIGGGRARGFVNAILRRVHAVTPDGYERLNHPAWLIDRWVARYGEEETTRWCAANAEDPPLYLVTGHQAALVAAWAGGELHAAGDGVFRAGATGPIPELPGFDEGLFWIQDPAAVAVADMLGSPVAVLDACAAPGGKSFRLASRGAQVLAVDKKQKRLNLLQASAKRLGLSIASKAHDWTRGPIEGLPAFPAVLVDAPCSGLGTVRRHPEIRWRLTDADLAPLAERQAEILQHCAAHVAQDGTLVYAVCSAEPEEGSEIVEQFLASHTDFRLSDTLEIAPPDVGADAFYAARMHR